MDARLDAGVQALLQDEPRHQLVMRALAHVPRKHPQPRVHLLLARQTPLLRRLLSRRLVIPL